MARDVYHIHVKEALLKDGWIITHDPLILMPDEDGVAVDLGAQKPITAEKDKRKIAIEVKSFTQPSLIYSFHSAIGQYLNYLLALEQSEEARELFLAVSDEIFARFKERKLIRLSLEKYKVKLLIFNPDTRSISGWEN